MHTPPRMLYTASMTVREDIAKFKEDVDYPVLFVLALPIALTLSISKQFLKLLAHGSSSHYTDVLRYPANFAAFTPELLEAHEDKRGDKLALLRNYLRSNNYVLTGYMKKAVVPRIEYEDLCKICLSKDMTTPYMLQHITFGEDLNKIISEAFGMPLKKERKTKTTYFIFKNGETFDFESELRRLYYSDKVRVKVIDMPFEK